MKKLLDRCAGRMKLIEEGYDVYHPEYAALYGEYLRLLKRLSYRNGSAEKKVRLSLTYSRGAESAKFWATYKGDVSSLSRADKISLTWKEKRRTIHLDSSQYTELS